MWLSSVVLNVIAMGLAYPNAMASIGIFVIATILAIIYNTVRYRIRAAELVVGAARLKPRGYLNCQFTWTSLSLPQKFWAESQRCAPELNSRKSPRLSVEWVQH